MLNVSIPEFHQQEEPGADPERNPEEQNPDTNPEPALETGEQANLDSDLDPVQEAASLPAAAPVPASLPASLPESEQESKPEAESKSEPVPEAAPQKKRAPGSKAEPEPETRAEIKSEPVIEPRESFGDLLYEFERTHSHKVEDGSRQIDATVVTVSAESVFLDIGYKTEGILPLTAFAGSPALKEAPKPGDKVRVTVKGRNEEGYYELTLLKIAQPKDWSSLEAAFAEKSTVVGTVTGVVKGGLSVDVGVRAFMPASRSGTREASELEKLVGQEIRCRIIKLDVADEDVVVDRRLILEEDDRMTKERRYSEVNVGDTIRGTVRSLTDYGAFVDIGGVDALLHISDMSWSHVASPSDVLSVGEQVEAKVLKIEPEKRRISIGLKQLQPHPWDAVQGKYTAGERVKGVVTRLTDFGAFVELSPGVEGLVHISEMSWGKKVRKPGDVVNPGDAVEVVILSVNTEERRLSLGLKQALGDPWIAVADNLAAGSIVEGPIVSFTKFGAFLQVAEGVEGLIHISEISADKRINHPQDELKIGQIVKAQVLEVDKEKRQLKLSIKQLIPTGLEEFVTEHKEGDVVSGRILEVTRRDGGDRLMVELGDGIRIGCKLPAPVIEQTPERPESAMRPDLSTLSSMLKARWKSGPAASEAPSNKKSEGARAGQVRNFRITSLDPAEKRIEIELA